MAKFSFRGLSLLLCCFVTVSIHAGVKPAFIFPVDCHYGVNCFIQNYLDHDPSESYRDFQCQRQTYNQHSGTDIRLINLPAMKAGVAVIAAEAGEVVAVRDGITDTYLNAARRTETAEIGLGNAVVIRHAEGWRTIYGHMKRGSLQVKSGDWVSQGQKLGEIGLSGLTEFPHVHFEVRHQGHSIDPFTGHWEGAECGDTKNSLWPETVRSQLGYFSGYLLDQGFSDKRPLNYQAIESGRLNSGAGKNSPHLFFWVRLIGLKAGDQATLRFISPDGKRAGEQRFSALTRHKAQQFYYIGMKNPISQANRWQGQVIVERASVPVIEQTFDYTVDGLEAGALEADEGGRAP